MFRTLNAGYLQPNIIKVINELIKNAYESVAERGLYQGHIDLKMVSSEGRFVLFVSDNGVGISRETLGPAFEDKIRSSKGEAYRITSNMDEEHTGWGLLFLANAFKELAEFSNIDDLSIVLKTSQDGKKGFIKTLQYQGGRSNKWLQSQINEVNDQQQGTVIQVELSGDHLKSLPRETFERSWPEKGGNQAMVSFFHVSCPRSLRNGSWAIQ